MKKIIYIFVIICLVACSKDDRIDYKNLIGMWEVESVNGLGYLHGLEVISGSKCRVYHTEVVPPEVYTWYYDGQYVLNGNEMSINVVSGESLIYHITILEYSELSMTCEWDYPYTGKDGKNVTMMHTKCRMIRTE